MERQDKKEASKLSPDQLRDKLRGDLEDKSLADSVRSNLNLTDPTKADVFSHRKDLLNNQDLRAKLKDLQNVDADLDEVRADLPDSLKDKLKRLNDLATPHKDSEFSL